MRGMMQNLIFHRQLSRIGKLESIAAKEFDAVVLPGIVGSGDNNAGVEPVRPREKCDRGSGDDTGAFDSRSSFAQAFGESGGYPRAGFARVAAENHFRLCGRFAQGVCQCEADAVDRRRIEGALSCDGANAVGAKEFACSIGGHCADLLLRLLGFGARGGSVVPPGEMDSTRLEKAPSARRVVSWSPEPICAVERISVPSFERTSA